LSINVLVRFFPQKRTGISTSAGPGASFPVLTQALIFWCLICS
jgi:hypothetical protein